MMHFCMVRSQLSDSCHTCEFCMQNWNSEMRSSLLEAKYIIPNYGKTILSENPQGYDVLNEGITAEGWSLLQFAYDATLRGQPWPATLKKKELYDLCDAICAEGHPKRLTECLITKTCVFIREVGDELQQRGESFNDDDETKWLSTIAALWQRIAISLRIAEAIFAPLDRYYLYYTSAKSLRSIIFSALWYDFRSRKRPIAWRLTVKAILAAIEALRNVTALSPDSTTKSANTSSDRSKTDTRDPAWVRQDNERDLNALRKNLSLTCEMLHSLDMLTGDVENGIMQGAEEFHDAQSRYALNLPLVDFVETIIRRLREEAELLTLCSLDSGLVPTQKVVVFKYLRYFEAALIGDYFEADSSSTGDAVRSQTDGIGTVTIHTPSLSGPTIIQETTSVDNLRESFSLSPNKGLLELVLSNNTDVLEAVYRLAAAFNLTTNLCTVWRECLKYAGTEIFKTHFGAQWTASVYDNAAGDPAILSSSLTASSAQHALALLGADSRNVNLLLEQLIKFHQQVYEVLEQRLDDDAWLRETIKDAFIAIVNQSAYLSRYVAAALADWLLSLFPILVSGVAAKYLDELLRNERLNVDIGKEQIRHLLSLFRALNSKDFFKMLYWKDIARRLLRRASSNDALEWAVVDSLKDECGASFTNKIEELITGISSSVETFAAFRKSKLYADISGTVPLDFECVVVSAISWPFSRRREMPSNGENDSQTIASSPTRIEQPAVPTLPKEIMYWQSAYEKFYQSLEERRELRWEYTFGSVSLSATFWRENQPKPDVYLLQVKPMQAIILLLFNEHDELDPRSVAELTLLDKGDIRKALISLHFHERRRLLEKCSTDSADPISRQPIFRINRQFKSSQQKVTFMNVTLREARAEEILAAEAKEAEDKSLPVDAFIVRTLKAQKVMSHNELLEAIYRNPLLRVPASFIESRIGNLIEREFITKDNEDPQSYLYVP